MLTLKDKQLVEYIAKHFEHAGATEEGVDAWLDDTSRRWRISRDVRPFDVQEEVRRGKKTGAVIITSGPNICRRARVLDGCFGITPSAILDVKKQGLSFRAALREVADYLGEVESKKIGGPLRRKLRKQYLIDPDILNWDLVIQGCSADLTSGYLHCHVSRMSQGDLWFKVVMKEVPYEDFLKKVAEILKVTVKAVREAIEEISGKWTLRPKNRFWKIDVWRLGSRIYVDSFPGFQKSICRVGGKISI